jgi:photosystem II stability/assembly factor-like uncharacterized protein
MSRFVIIGLLMSVSMLSAETWDNRGPYGGSFQAFAFHPSKENLVFASGLEGLFRSTDTGKTWQRLKMAGGEYVVRIHSLNDSSILAASSSNGIFQSLDEGETWKLYYRYEFEGDFFHDMEFDSQDPQKIYAVTFYNGVYRSQDGGLTWNQKNKGLKWKTDKACCIDLPQIEVDPNNGKIAYALLPNRIVYRTSNEGESWQAANQGLKFTEEVHALSIDPKDSVVLYAGGANGIFRSLNGGKNWTSRRCECYIWSFAVHPTRTDQVFGVGQGAVRSMDAGKTWQWFTPHPFLSGILLGVAVHPLNPQIVFVGGFGGGIFRSTDSGRSWETVNERLDALNVIRLAADPSKSGRFFAVGGQQAFESRDGGKTWELFLKGQGSTFWVSDLALHPKNSNFIVVAGYRKSGGALSLSQDGGKTWQIRSPYSGVNYGCSRCVAFDPSDPQIMYLAPFTKQKEKSISQGIAKSLDQGKTWKLINNGLTHKDIWTLAVNPRNTDLVFAGTGGGTLYRSENGGNDWRMIQGLDHTSIRDIVFDETNQNIVYLSTYTSVFKSIDGGINWVKKSGGLPDAWLNSLYFGSKESNELYVAGEAGVFITKDGGENWTRFGGNGPGPFAVWTILRDPSNKKSLLAGTDRGVFTYSIDSNDRASSNP